MLIILQARFYYDGTFHLAHESHSMVLHDLLKKLTLSTFLFSSFCHPYQRERTISASSGTHSFENDITPSNDPSGYEFRCDEASVLLENLKFHIPLISYEDHRAQVAVTKLMRSHKNYCEVALMLQKEVHALQCQVQSLEEVNKSLDQENMKLKQRYVASKDLQLLTGILQSYKEIKIELSLLRSYLQATIKATAQQAEVTTVKIFELADKAIKTHLIEYAQLQEVEEQRKKIQALLKDALESSME